MKKKCEIKKKKDRSTKVNEVLPVINLVLNQLASLIFKEQAAKEEQVGDPFEEHRA